MELRKLPTLFEIPPFYVTSSFLDDSVANIIERSFSTHDLNIAPFPHLRLIRVKRAHHYYC